MVASDDETGRVIRSQNGDHEAFESLIKEYQIMIHSLCYRMTGSLTDADDLAQETFICAYRELAGFRAEARFSSWLYRIAVNLCLNWRKSGARRRRLQNELAGQLFEAESNEHCDSTQVQEALMRLSPKERAAISLTTYEGLTHAEAAQALSCSETTISWRLFTARAKLKRMLKDLKRGKDR
ncbi:MAG TPA: RNA polymerase sigma factor [Candidatus Dormibacteraeota bacterium]|nr:RNA polymerase sigma factor [Candidatus Dormibacteraeota bacterium]